jgi:hypothetical protein
VYYERAQAINSGHNDRLNVMINFKFWVFLVSFLT